MMASTRLCKTSLTPWIPEGFKKALMNGVDVTQHEIGFSHIIIRDRQVLLRAEWNSDRATREGGHGKVEAQLWAADLWALKVVPARKRRCAFGESGGVPLVGATKVTCPVDRLELPE